MANMMRRTEVAFGAAVARQVRQVRPWFALLLGGATWGLGPRAEAGKPAAVGAGRASREGVSMLRVDPVGALVPFRFEGLDLVARPLHGASHEPANGMRLPSHLLHGVDKQMHLRRRVSQYVSA
jgi:hypothetical protein